MKYNAAQTACETFAYGEVEEDYCKHWRSAIQALLLLQLALI
jgi:hypothetical protein